MRKLTQFAIVSAMGLAWAGASQAANPVLGFDPTGGSCLVTCFYADNYSDQQNTGVDEVVFTSAPDTSFAGFVVGDIHRFTTQVRVDSFDLGGAFNSPPGLNTNFELTKTISFKDQVTNFIGSPGGISTVVFEEFLDNDTNLTLWYDADLSDGSASVSGDGAGTVRCYGDNNGGAGNTCPGDDGIAILEASLIDDVSTFTALSANVGLGAFDLLFEITNYNPLYLDISNLVVDGGTGKILYGVKMEGSLNVPSTNNPALMWNGVDPSDSKFGADNIQFGIDASESFATSAVPVPGSLLLMGSALIGLMGSAKRKRKAA